MFLLTWATSWQSHLARGSASDLFSVVCCVLSSRLHFQSGHKNNPLKKTKKKKYRKWSSLTHGCEGFRILLRRTDYFMELKLGFIRHDEKSWLRQAAHLHPGMTENPGLPCYRSGRIV